jgi:hypothetical protein
MRSAFPTALVLVLKYALICTEIMPSSKKNANGNDDDCLVLGVGLFWAPS